MPTLTQNLSIASPTTALKFDKLVSWYGSQTLGAVCNFTADLTNAVQGAETYVELLTNGGYVPTFAATMVKVGDRNWTQLPVGTKNLLKFKHLGGVVYYEYVLIPLPPADTTAPTLVSAVTSGTGQITMTFSEVLQGNITTADFAMPLSGRTISAAFISGDQVNLIVTPALVGGDNSYRVSYYRPATAANRLRDVAGNQVADIVEAVVTNTIVDTTPPTATGAIGLGTSVILTFSEPLNPANMPAAAAFNLVGTNAPAVLSFVRSAAHELTLTTSFATPGTGVNLTYSQPGAPTTRLQDAAGNQTPSFSIPVN